MRFNERRLVTTPSLKFLLDMVSNAKKEIIVVSPWIKHTTLQKVINATKSDENIKWKVLTRGNHDDFCQGSSDIDAFKLMVNAKSFDLRSIKQLHAKVYIVDGILSLVTSANLTVSGMEINTEAGIASADSNDVLELIKEFDVWFKQATSLDKLWLVEEQQKLLTSKKHETLEPEVPFNLTDYNYSQENQSKNNDGKYRKLQLPTIWIPTLNSLQDAETPTYLDYLQVNDLTASVADFFKYAEEIQNGKRIQEFLVNRFIQKQSLEIVGDEKVSKERVSQKIGNRKNYPENIWNSVNGEYFIRQLSLFLNNVIGNTELRVSGILSSTKLQPIGLSPLDLCQFICGLIDKGIVVGNYRAEITPTNQLLICNKEIYAVLNKLDRIFHADYQEFMDLEKFCSLGEFENIDDAWFSPDFKVFKNLYITKNRKIISRNWGVEKLMRAIAWELADNIDCYHWHFSEMREALRYLFPAKFRQTSLQYVNTRLSGSPDKFHHAGSKGIWQLTDLGDGYNNNKEAIISILHRASNTPLNYKDVIKELRGMGRRVNEGSIYALLDQDDAFIKISKEMFRLNENLD